MKKLLHLIFVGDNGKLSVTALFGLLSLAVVVNLFVKGLIYGIPISDSWLTWSIQLIEVAVIGRAGQRGLQYLGNGIATIGKNNLATADEKPTEPEPKPTPKPEETFIYPCNAPITSGFRTPQRPTHHGIDLAAKGKVPVVAAADGIVVKSYPSSTYGETVILEHELNGLKWQTLYAHLAKNTRVKNGVVKQGQQIGLMGSTGRSTAQHLHFEIHQPEWNYQKSFALDPEKYLT